MPTFKSMNGENSSPNFQEPIVTNKVSNPDLFVPKVFGVMFIGLLLTALIALGAGFLFTYLLESGNEIAVDVSIFTLFASSIGLIILSIVAPIVLARGKAGAIVPFILYIIFMGILLSSLVMAIPYYILVESVTITAVIFGLISLIGLLSKGKIKGLGITILGLFVGVILISIVNLIFFLFGNEYFMEGTYWLISYIYFAISMFIAIWDVNRIKQISQSGYSANRNLVLYCAFIIYTDFINILIRVILLLARNKK